MDTHYYSEMGGFDPFSELIGEGRYQREFAARRQSADPNNFHGQTFLDDLQSPRRPYPVRPVRLIIPEERRDAVKAEAHLAMRQTREPLTHLAEPKPFAADTEAEIVPVDLGTIGQAFDPIIDMARIKLQPPQQVRQSDPPPEQTREKQAAIVRAAEEDNELLWMDRQGRLFNADPETKQPTTEEVGYVMRYEFSAWPEPEPGQPPDTPDPRWTYDT